MDRMTEMEAFVTVVDQGGFTNAARKMGLSRSVVSKHVSALETRLGARLLNRTTRRVAATEIGLAYCDRARRVLSDAGEADALVAALDAAPSGRLRISVVSDFGAHCLSPLLGGFLCANAAVTVEMVLQDRFVDLSAEGFDLSIRIGESDDPSLNSLRIARTRQRMIAAPGYLTRRGRPGRIEDLGGHRLLHRSDAPGGPVWRITAPSGAPREVRLASGLTVNDGPSLLNAALSGLGIARLPGYLCAEALAEGRLVEVLPDLPPAISGIYAACPAGRISLPKVRAFLAFLHDSLSGARTAGW